MLKDKKRGYTREPNPDLSKDIESIINALRAIDSICKKMAPKIRFSKLDGWSADALIVEENWHDILSRDFESCSNKEKWIYIKIELYIVYRTSAIESDLSHYRYATYKVIGEYAEAAAENLESGNLLIAYSALRGLIEALAHHNSVSVKTENYLRDTTKPKQDSDDNLHDYSTYLLGLINILHEEINAERFNWKRALAAETLLMSEKQRKKKTPEEKAKPTLDKTATSIMSSIDLLDKSVTGTRSAYELLCEYVHPNRSQRNIYVDTTKEIAIDYTGMKIRFYGGSGSGTQLQVDAKWAIAIQACSCVLQLLSRFLDRSAALEKDTKTLHKQIQQYTRRAIKSTPVFTADDPCPCGSAKKIGNCCGRKLKAHFLGPSDRRHFPQN